MLACGLLGSRFDPKVVQVDVEETAKRSQGWRKAMKPTEMDRNGIKNGMR